jgi:chemotaxis protein CheD
MSSDIPFLVSRPDSPEKALRGFSSINRYWDKNRNLYAAKILPGEYYVTVLDEFITTVLGSCVSACIRDRVSGVGGMNHFMLPKGAAGEKVSKMGGLMSDSGRYGSFAMENMINAILKNGGVRENLEVKIVGGGKIIKNMTNIGQQNIDFVREYIKAEGLNLIGEEVGDIYPRKVRYHPLTGKVNVKKLRAMHNDTIRSREESYLHEIEQKPVSGDVELF